MINIPVIKVMSLQMLSINRFQSTTSLVTSREAVQQKRKNGLTERVHALVPGRADIAPI